MICTVDGPDFEESGPFFLRRTKKSRHRAELVEYAEYIAATFGDACEGAGLAQNTSSGAGMPVTIRPQVTHVQMDDPIWFTVRLCGGMIAADVEKHAPRLAECLGVQRIAVEPRRNGWVRIILDPADPLACNVSRPIPVSSVHDPLLFGQLESGADLRRSLVDSTHIAVQGATGSGKSVFCYNLLSQMSEASDVRVVGSDPSGLLLQPWATAANGWHALGTKNLEMHAVVLERLVTEMDDRLDALPAGTDKVSISPDTPLLFAVLEEYPGLLRAAQRHDDQLASNARSKRLLPRIQGAYARLLSEGRKAGIRLLIIAQRADADILGGYERGQVRLRFSFAVDTADAIKMLHPASAADLIEDHMVAEAGISLVTAPGIRIDRMRAPDNYPFDDYCQHVMTGVSTPDAA